MIINRKAPRMRKGEFSTLIFGKKLWKKFKQDIPEYKEISWNEFKQIWVEITETIRNEAIMNPLGVKLPLYLGELKYQYLPYKYKALDVDSTEKNEDAVNHMNLITRGKTGKIKWERRWACRFFKMLGFYSFENDKRMNAIAKKYTMENPEKIRISRALKGKNNGS
jgi:hypothetical protein